MAWACQCLAGQVRVSCVPCSETFDRRAGCRIACSTSRGCESSRSLYRVRDDRQWARDCPTYEQAECPHLHAWSCGPTDLERMRSRVVKIAMFLSFLMVLPLVSRCDAVACCQRTRLLPWRPRGTRRRAPCRVPCCETFPPPAYYLGIFCGLDWAAGEFMRLDFQWILCLLSQRRQPAV